MGNFCATFKKLKFFKKCTANKKKYHFSIHPITDVFIPNVSQIEDT